MPDPSDKTPNPWIAYQSKDTEVKLPKTNLDTADWIQEKHMDYNLTETLQKLLVAHRKKEGHEYFTNRFGTLPENSEYGLMFPYHNMTELFEFLRKHGFKNLEQTIHRINYYYAFTSSGNIITLPLRDKKGRVAGFVCRSTEDNPEQKYKKAVYGNIIQCFYKVKEYYGPNDMVTIVEGYPDAEILSSYGLDVVAMGTENISKGQLQDLYDRGCRHVIFNWDSEYADDDKDKKIEIGRSMSRKQHRWKERIQSAISDARQLRMTPYILELSDKKDLMEYWDKTDIDGSIKKIRDQLDYKQKEFRHPDDIYDEELYDKEYQKMLDWCTFAVRNQWSGKTIPEMRVDFEIEYANF